LCCAYPPKGSTASHGGRLRSRPRCRPHRLAGNSRQAKLEGNGFAVTVSGLPASWHGRALQPFPETANIAEPVTSPQTADKVSGDGLPSQGKQVWQNGVWSGSFPLSVQREGTVDQLPIVLALGAQSLRTVATVSGTWPALESAGLQPPVGVSQPGSGNATSAAATASTAAQLPLAQPTGWSSWILALGCGAAGRHDPEPDALRAARAGHQGAGLFPPQRTQPRLATCPGLAYTLGVVLSFVSLGALLLGLRAAGEQLGWGFQLQNPLVISGLAVLFTVLGLNLAGVFEFGQFLPSGVAGLHLRHPVADAFLSGVLAVAIASPCTAPFMGASLGLAVGLPAAQALGIFAALGLGMALPYVLLSWAPGLLRWLPRPGPWMATFRRAMAFPMLATVVWLAWVLGHLSGSGRCGALLALLLMPEHCWSGRWVMDGRSRTIAFASISIASIQLF
jgi:hypothetical protein